MKRKMIAYWICTVVIALCIGSGGAAQVLRVPQNVEGMTALGYPLHFIVLLGVWKVLGALTLLAPGLRLVKEWAYAGIFIDLSGAVVASAANAGGAFHVIAPIVLIGILAASWALRPESRRCDVFSYFFFAALARSACSALSSADATSAATPSPRPH
jgi:DoxX-like protein